DFARGRQHFDPPRRIPIQCECSHERHRWICSTGEPHCGSAAEYRWIARKTAGQVPGYKRGPSDECSASNQFEGKYQSPNSCESAVNSLFAPVQFSRASKLLRSEFPLLGLLLPNLRFSDVWRIQQITD